MIPLGRLDLDDAQREQVRNVMRENVHSAFRSGQSHLINGLRVDLGLGRDYFENEWHDKSGINPRPWSL